MKNPTQKELLKAKQNLQSSNHGTKAPTPTHHSVWVKLDTVNEMNDFAKQFVKNDDILENYRTGVYGFPMMIQITSMVCGNGDLATWINSHDELKAGVELSTAAEFKAVNEAMAKLAA